MSHKVDLKEVIEKWREKIGLTQLRPFDTGEVEWALNIGREINMLSVNEIGACMIIIQNHLFTLSSLMGTIFARVKYLESTVSNRDSSLLECRAQLNIIKPFYDEVQSKLAVVKKIYDYKAKETLNVEGSRR